ncbi:hypothetical protein ABEB36_010810 [Hypothenemus hampei]|uniref:Retrotransposon gag domain-containing protein n=1 Tax=Hypothenemus hampei TaxID=57062 RepID=A0ABD1ED73_HYPHA
MKKLKINSKKLLEDISYPKLPKRNQLEEKESSELDINSLHSHISLELPIENNTEMADALRSTVTLLKTFDGTPSHLETFIHQIDTFYTRYFNNDAAQQEYVILAIKSKITKEAENFLLTRPDLNSWHEIKTALRQKFSDPITRANLQQQLIFLSRQRNESTQDYIQKLKALVTKINTKICTEVIQNPQNLDNAIDIITNCEILTSQSYFKNNFIQNHTSTKQNTQKPTNTPFFTNFQKLNQTPIQFPRQPIVKQTPIIRQPHTNTNFQPIFKPATKPQVQFPKFNQNFNQTNKQQYPQPMSGISVQTQRNPSQIRPNQFQRSNQNPFQTTNAKPNFTFEELTHLENENDHEINYQANEEYEIEDELSGNNYPNFEHDQESLAEKLENFQLTASENKGTRKATEKATIPLLANYGLTTPVEFILYPIHEYFDGILGIKDLCKLKLNIDLENGKLKNKNLEIPFSYRQDFEQYTIEIPAKTIRRIKFQTKLPENKGLSKSNA